MMIFSSILIIFNFLCSLLTFVFCDTWTLVETPNSNYEYYYDPIVAVNFADAVKICDYYNGRVLNIENQLEENYIKEMFFNTYDIWLAVYDFIGKK